MFLNTSTAAGGSAGDGTADGDGNDELQPPSSTISTPFAVGIRSARLTGPGVADYLIFDTEDANNPDIIRPAIGESNAEELDSSSEDLPSGTYDALELEIVFYEAAITAHDGTADHVRRLRVYFVDNYEETLPASSRTVLKNDLLISDDTSDFDPPSAGIYNKNTDPTTTARELKWIHRDDGDLCTSATRATCVGTFAVYQGNPTQFSGYPTVSLPLKDKDGNDTTLEITSDTDANFVLNIELGIDAFFFFDDTDASDNDFSFLESASNDGKIERACNPSNCSENDTADFWSRPPTFTVKVTGQ
jgi:hypothetical protein